MGPTISETAAITSLQCVEEGHGAFSFFFFLTMLQTPHPSVSMRASLQHISLNSHTNALHISCLLDMAILIHSSWSFKLCWKDVQWLGYIESFWKNVTIELGYAWEGFALVNQLETQHWRSGGPIASRYPDIFATGQMNYIVHSLWAWPMFTWPASQQIPGWWVASSQSTWRTCYQAGSDKIVSNP